MSTVLGGSVEEKSLEGHNVHRRNAALSELKWDSQLEKSAEAYSRKLGTDQDCMKLQHSKGEYGENLYMTSKGKDNASVAEAGCKAWYSELKDYKYPGETEYLECGPDSFMKVGHLTQMMWAQTSKVGCGVYICAGDYAIYTCHYLPQGNMAGATIFAEENFKKLCASEDGWSSCKSELQAACSSKPANSTDGGSTLLPKATAVSLAALCVQIYRSII